MSIIFGIRKPKDAMVTLPELRALADRTEAYAIGGSEFRVAGRIGMGFQPYCTHQRSRLEIRPQRDDVGNMLSFDGRLDNYSELTDLLGIDRRVSDSTIVLHAFERWGEGCFGRLIGDWALSLWAVAEEAIYLARDHAGTRSLYFEQKGELRWSTYLETFFDGRRRQINEAYAACYLACEPVREMTPFEGITSVPPAHYVKICEGEQFCRPHWTPSAERTLLYDTDAEYDEQFLYLFRQSVSRRTVPGAPILAHLSGGMDSTSIVCMSDSIREKEKNEELLDTLSYYDNSEASWNETPYFNIVEEKRGKRGIHIDLGHILRSFEVYGPTDGTFLWPGADRSTLPQEIAFEAILGQKEFKTILSGVGGDELLGGSPNALPELSQYLISGNLKLWLKRSLEWSLADRTSLLQLLTNTCIFTARLYRQPRLDSLPSWLSERHRKICAKRARETNPQGRLQSSSAAIYNGIVWSSLMETLNNSVPRFLCRREFRYPYLDRDLVDFLLRIPREQLVRPGRRRSLMRRALRGITPVEVLERRRKAFMSRRLQDSLLYNTEHIDDLLKNPLGARIGLYERKSVVSGLDAALRDEGFRSRYAIERLLVYELWLRGNQESICLPGKANYDSAPAARSNKDPDNILSGRMSCLEIAEK